MNHDEHSRLHPMCLKCLLGKHLDAAPKEAGEKAQTEYIQRLLQMLGHADPATAAPVMLRRIEKLQEEMFGASIDYAAIKKHYNAKMMGKEEGVREKIRRAADPFRAALQYAMTGNYIDFGTLQKVDDAELDAFLADAENIPLPEDTLEELRNDVLRAKKIVYLTDNCGEIVMDKLLMETMLSMNPQAEMQVILRGEEVVNDVTVEDACQVGLDRIAPVMGNGTDIAGTWIPSLSDAARKKLESADVIIAKGQGNFETLYFCGLNVYYLFMCKCDLFAQRFRVPRFTGMLLNDRKMQW
ncbi:MAG: DUF89 family protein [Clostridia bacterium]|nr:DUF89 family protein [Clostridia bacterium]